MTTAKPHQTAGQSDSADDLIAELAKLMAQDGQSEPAAPMARPVPPTAQEAPRPVPQVPPAPVAATPVPPPAATPAPTIRIPSVASEPQQPVIDAPTPVPRFEFARQPAATPAPAPRQEPVFAPPPAATTPAATPAPAEPFDFDFGLSPAKPTQAPPPQQPVETRPVDVRPNLAPEPRTFEPRAFEPRPADVRPAPAPPPAAPRPAASVAAPEPDMHDTIADLIAAELQNEPPVQPMRAPEPAPVEQVAPGVPPVEVASVPTPPVSAPAAENRTGQAEPARLALRAVNLTPAPKSENDKFRVAPVFGLGTTPPAKPPGPIAPEVTARSPEPVVPEARQPAPAPRMFTAPDEPPAPAPVPERKNSVGLDPIDEIESLIGRAVRVDLDRASEPAVERVIERPAPSPALRSLATPTAPQSAPKSAPRSLSGADEAILAAAAATGAEVGWVNPPDAPEGKPVVQRRGRKERAQRSPGFARALIGPLVAVVLLLIAGFGLYWVLGLGRSEGPAPVLTADTAPVKEVPPVQANPAQAQQSVVFNEMEGVVPGAEEQLVSRDQADVNEVTRVAPPSVSEEGLANRKVRTVTVRPDGSIVSGDDALAGSAILPVDRPNVPAVPGAATASPELLANAAAVPTPTPAPTATAPVTPSVVPVVAGTSVPVVDATGNVVAGKTAPVPYQRPASVGDAPARGPTNAPVTAVVDPVGALIEPPASATERTTIVTAPAPAQQAPAQQAPAPTLLERITGRAPQAAAPAGGSAPAYVQLSSQRSEADARASAQQIAARYGSLFDGASLEIQQVNLGERGIYYRVRVPASSLQNAAAICSSVKANGGDCFTM